MMHSSGITTTTRMFAVLADATVTMAHMAAKFAGLLEAGGHITADEKENQDIDDGAIEEST